MTVMRCMCLDTTGTTQADVEAKSLAREMEAAGVLVMDAEDCDGSMGIALSVDGRMVALRAPIAARAAMKSAIRKMTGNLA